VCAAWSKAWVCGRSLAGIAGSNPAGGMYVCISLVSVVCCQVKVSATGQNTRPEESHVSAIKIINQRDIIPII
jgi:hypothetical protein